MNPRSTAVDDALLIASFNLGGAAFGIDARQVQEVAKVGEVTRVHHAPPDVVGIRNLRGRIVTVIDLRARLNLGRVETSPENRVLICDWQDEPIGLLVDSVADMITTSAADLVPPPPNLHGVPGSGLRGVCRGEGRLVGLLDHGTLLRLRDESEATSNRELAAT